MSRLAHIASTGTILVAGLVAVLVAAPVTASETRFRATDAHAPSVDLGRALTADGTYRGSSSLRGVVDASAWALASDLSAGEPPRFVARGDSATASAGPWSAVGDDGAGGGALASGVGAIAVSGTDVYVGGSFQNAAGIPEADRVAKWDGVAWSALGGGSPDGGAIPSVVTSLAVSGSDLYVGGWFGNVWNVAGGAHLAKWNGSAWSGFSPDPGLTDAVYAIAVSGSDLYVGGAFINAAGIAEADHLVKWNGSAWSALGQYAPGSGALNDDVFALAVSGSNLYVGGAFSGVTGNTKADYIARWNGSAWSALGSNGANDAALGDVVKAIAVSGTDVYVGGTFQNAANLPKADHIAKWNGSVWSALGSDGSNNGAVGADVQALVFSGPVLYVAGAFGGLGGVNFSDHIARWSGGAWSALQSQGGVFNGTIYALAASTTNLYAGGVFTDAAGHATADYIAKWSFNAAVPHKPDGRVRLGLGAFAGNDVYNITGVGQTRTGSAARGHTIAFGISIQNDGSVSEKFRIKATGASASAYTVKYFNRTTDITAAVVAGTFQTTSLAPTETYLITAKVTVKSSAPAGSSVARLVTISSVGDGTKKDAVKFVGKRT